MEIIGAASDFWRLRLSHVDTSDEVDLEWRDDVLYRETYGSATADVELWHVEAIRVDDYDAIVRIATFTDRASADEYFDRATSDLAELTKRAFEDLYMTPSADCTQEPPLG